MARTYQFIPILVSVLLSLTVTLTLPFFPASLYAGPTIQAPRPLLNPSPLNPSPSNPSPHPSLLPSPSCVEALSPVDRLQQTLIKNYSSKKVRILKQAFEAFKKEQFTQAIKLATKIQTDPTYSDYGYWISASAYLSEAEKLMSKKSYTKVFGAAKKSIALNLQIIKENPESPFIRTVPSSLAQGELLIGDSYWGSRKWLLAQNSFEHAFHRLQSQNQLSLIDSYHLGKYAESCQKKSGPLCTSWLRTLLGVYLKKSNEFKAISAFTSLTPEKTKTYRIANKLTIPYKAPDLDQLAFDAAMKSYLDRKYSVAIKNFRQFLDDYPRSTHRLRARYWLAQSLEHDGVHAEAITVLTELQNDSPLSYYGLLASQLSGKPIDSVISMTIPMATENDSALQPPEQFHLNRAQHLVAEGAYELATYELKALKPREGLSSPFLVYLAMLNSKAKNYNSNFQVITELIQRGYDGVLSSYGLQIIFPVDFLDLIKKYAVQNDLDPILVLSLIKQESGFDEKVKSPVGALGLMQLMPGTASDTDSTVSSVRLLEADGNIKVGILYLKKLLKYFNGNISLALAGYNAGPKAVDRWIKCAPAQVSMQEFIETIPYRETREYVAGIVRNYIWYSRQLKGSLHKDFNYFWTTHISPKASAKLPTSQHLKRQNGNA